MLHHYKVQPSWTLREIYAQEVHLGSIWVGPKRFLRHVNLIREQLLRNIAFTSGCFKCVMIIICAINIAFRAFRFLYLFIILGKIRGIPM
jgi:hypothetical protein